MSTHDTRIDEIAEDIYRISTPVAIPERNFGFTFNQYLLRDDEPLLFHTGPRRMFALVREAISRVIPLPRCATWRFPTTRRMSAAH